YIMQNRTDAQNFYEDKLHIDNIEEYLKNKRRLGIKNIGLLHILIAAMVRTIAQKPGLNRFVAGQRIYARNEILVSLALKKQMNEGGIETTIKLKFSPTDTVFDVAEKINAAIEDNKKAETKNSADKTAKIIMLCPGFIVKFLVWFFKKLDYFGMMPKIINKISPMHTTMFITDLGSLGIQSIYHHLYEFGTTSIFVAFGAKFTERLIDKDNSIIQRRFVNIKIVTDERTVDGFYYASAFKVFKRLLQHPEQLEERPDKMVKDIL
ncbi:MAG TPA: 2-oxo acid dehydrogenase subunit E2, partial [Patescibacteria group bacterium]|nr:2-oxo acid dehydrogenase subunit E2 [Patescibacteria group bacterium]